MKKVKKKPSTSGKKKTSTRKSSPKAKTSKAGKAKSSKSSAKPKARASKSTQKKKEAPRRPVLRTPVPSPLPQVHLATPQPAIVAPARSMPPREEQIIPFAPVRPQVSSLPTEFDVGGVVLVISYSIRDGRRADFLNLIADLKPLLVSIGGTDFTLYEDRSRVNYFMEIFRFRDEAEFTAFDDKFHKDRKIAAIYGLLDEIVEAEKSDFKIYDRRL